MREEDCAALTLTAFFSFPYLASDTHLTEIATLFAIEHLFSCLKNG